MLDKAVDPTSSADEAASLYALPCLAFTSQQSSDSLSPFIGIVHNDESIQLLARKLQVPLTPDASVLVKLMPFTAHAEAVVLCKELANSLPGPNHGLRNLRVPTASRKLLPPSLVFIDDAPWTRQERLEVLHPDLPPQCGLMLDCCLEFLHNAEV